KPFDVTTILTAAVSNIIVSILIGKRYEYKDNKFQRLLKKNTIQFLWFLLVTPKLMIKNQSEIHDFIQTIENMNTKNDGYFRNENLIGLVDDLFGAGTETMANTLCWAILLMMKYPEIQ
ncbi:hypothetical protein E2320_019779, partial [Naja naja]